MTDNTVDLRSFKVKPGSIPYKLYVTLTLEGPSYDAVGIDAERDEFAIQFDDGCIRLELASLSWLMLKPEHLLALDELLEQAETAWEEWSESPAYNDFVLLDDPDCSDEHIAMVQKKYGADLDVRKPY
ncbi:hypothetical protein [Salipiger profundus]|uniref:hypothetical protein n=1 Tax=Salipiger profundus TaxID=1229727 RepID=UPI0008EE87E0|nr:hypothetical protein [Salipiger profundus]SFD98954.1 hypothetical protein SAMN05444415_1422 [Salipiger profundus]